MIDLIVDIEGVGPERLAVFAVSGEEELSRLYVFDVFCLSARGAQLDPECVGRRATLTITLDGAAPRLVQGLVSAMAILQPALFDQLVYRITVSPALAQLTLARHNRIYGTTEPKSVVDILDEMLRATLQRGALADDPRTPTLEHEFRLIESYPAFDHITQYEESDFAFLSRLTEHWGIFFFFEHHNRGKDLVFADAPVFAPVLDQMAQLRVVRAGSSGGQPSPNLVQRFEATYRQTPNRVFLQESNELNPKMPLLVSAEVDPQGIGDFVEYGDHYRTPDEGAFLARVRAEELRCAKVRFSGRSTAAWLAPGYVFDLSGHEFQSWNTRYLALTVRHLAGRPVPGLPSRAALAGLIGDDHPAASADGYGYLNDFTAMEFSQETRFRPQRRTPRPRIDGLLNGRIEASLDGKSSHINSDGWYRVRLPFDLGTTPDGLGSRWIRKAEPYGGPSNGMHFPLPPGAEVVVACINGDPDRPVIVGAVPSADTPSVVTAPTRSLNRIETVSGIVFTMADFTRQT
jgi:type VI secretion system VgrG family protein